MNLRNTIESRRSINYFDPERKIDSAKVDEILTLASFAPSTMNLQPWKVITALSDEKKALLRSVSYDQPKVTEASAVFIVLANKAFVEENTDAVIQSMIDNGYVDEAGSETYRGMAAGMHGEPDSVDRMKSAVLSSSLFGMNIMYSAIASGLEAHPMGGFDPVALKKEFAIDEKFEPVMLIAVGYLKPGIELLPRNIRFKPKEFNETV